MGDDLCGDRRGVVMLLILPATLIVLMVIMLVMAENPDGQ
jgi:hypothetical protein